MQGNLQRMQLQSCLSWTEADHSTFKSNQGHESCNGMLDELFLGPIEQLLMGFCFVLQRCAAAGAASVWAAGAIPLPAARRASE